jgi:hypothetical protein
MRAVVMLQRQRDDQLVARRRSLHLCNARSRQRARQVIQRNPILPFLLLSLLHRARPSPATVRACRRTSLTASRLSLDPASVCAGSPNERAVVEAFTNQVLAPRADGVVRQDHVLPSPRPAVCHSAQPSRCEPPLSALGFSTDNDRCLVYFHSPSPVESLISATALGSVDLVRWSRLPWRRRRVGGPGPGPGGEPTHSPV